MNGVSKLPWQDYRRWGPFFAAGLLISVAVGFAVGRSSRSSANGDSDAAQIKKSDSDRQFELALSRQGELLAEGKYAEAYDYLLAAARLSPSDPRLLSAVFTFIEKAVRDDDAEASVLAEDLYVRADMLIPYQSVDAISNGRKKYIELSRLFRSDEPPKPAWFADVAVLVSKAANKEIKLDLRSRLIDQARNELDELALRGATNALGLPSSDDFWKQHSALASRLATIESEIVNALYAQERQKAQTWLTEASGVNVNSESINPKQVPKFIAELNARIQDGYTALRTLSPYSTSQISDSVEVARQVQDRISLLERTKLWMYNQQALRRIRAVENTEDVPGLEKIKLLAEIHEDQLSPYIQRRFQKVWDEAFDSCSEEEKVAAVKMRVLRAKD